MIKLKNNIEDLLDSLSKSKFRGSFHLNKKMKNYVKEKGFDKIKSDARDLITKRIAPKNPNNDGKNISPEKIVSKAMKRLDKIYNRWDENIKDDIRKLIKLLRLYVHEIKASEECQKAMDSMVN